MIEVNVSPDISYSTPITARLVSAGVADLMRLVIHEGKVRSSNTKDNNAEVDNDPPSALQWDLWHYGLKEGTHLQINDSIFIIIIIIPIITRISKNAGIYKKEKRVCHP